MSKASANLDLLRSTAVLLVLMNHLLEVFGFTTNAALVRWGIIDLGHFGVLMFFIHTSLVLMMSLERLARDGGPLTSRFYVRRAFRIYPLSIATVLVMATLRLPAYFEPHYSWQGWKVFWANIFLYQNLFNWPSFVGPLWSLPFEVQMYLLLPVLFYTARRIRSNRLAAAVIFVAMFAAWYIEGHIARFVGYPRLLGFAPWFCLGVSAWCLGRNQARRLAAGWYAASLAGLVAGSCLSHRFVGSWQSGWVTWGCGVGFALVLPFSRDIAAGVISRAAHVVAKYSYGIYLAHVPILWLAFQKLSGQAMFLQLAVFCVLIVAIPVFLFHAIEDPFIGIGARVAESIGSPAEVIETPVIA